MASQEDPRETVARIHQETVKGLQDPSVKDKLAKLGVEEMVMTPEDFDARIAKSAHRPDARQGGRDRGEIAPAQAGNNQREGPPCSKVSRARRSRPAARASSRCTAARAAGAADARQSILARLLHKVAPRLAEEFTVVATDLRGYGDSEKPPAATTTAATPSHHGAGPGRGNGRARL